MPMGSRAPRVGCLRAEATLKEGVAESDQIVLSGDEVSVEGRGSIDLGRGRYDLTLTPSTSDPALIGVAATVRVIGPLEEPEIRPVARSLVTSAARGVFANALRPGRAAQSSLELLRKATTTLNSSARDKGLLSECRVKLSAPSCPLKLTSARPPS